MSVSDTSTPDTPRAMPRLLVRTYIDPSLYQRFTEQFPAPGSISWLLETAMAEVLSITDGQPPLVDLVRGSIRSALLQRKLQTRGNNGQSRSVHVEPTDQTSNEL